MEDSQLIGHGFKPGGDLLLSAGHCFRYLKLFDIGVMLTKLEKLEN